MTVNLRHTQSGVLKPAPLGFSWTTLFFSGFPALFRGDLKWAVIMWIVEGSMLVLSFFTFGIASIVVHCVFAATYNKRYLQDLLGQGYLPADDHARHEMARYGVAVMPDPSGPQPPQRETDPEPAPARKVTLERQTLTSARDHGGILTPTDISIDAECDLDKAKKQLDNLVERGHAELRSTRGGDLVYAFPSLLSDAQKERLEPTL